MTNERRDRFSSFIDRAELERKENWMEIRFQMPFIQFKEDWKIKIIPPYAGAVARFVVLKPDGIEISVYCDFFGHLGAFGGPYWEIYPIFGVSKGESQRFALDEVKEMIDAIEAIGVKIEDPLENVRKQGVEP